MSSQKRPKLRRHRPAPAVLLVRLVPRKPLLVGRVFRHRVALVPRSVQPRARTLWLGIEVDGPAPRASVHQGGRLPFRRDIRFPPAGELAPLGCLPWSIRPRPPRGDRLHRAAPTRPARTSECSAIASTIGSSCLNETRVPSPSGSTSRVTTARFSGTSGTRQSGLQWSYRRSLPGSNASSVPRSM